MEISWSVAIGCIALVGVYILISSQPNAIHGIDYLLTEGKMLSQTAISMFEKGHLLLAEFALD